MTQNKATTRDLTTHFLDMRDDYRTGERRPSSSSDVLDNSSGRRLEESEPSWIRDFDELKASLTTLTQHITAFTNAVEMTCIVTFNAAQEKQNLEQVKTQLTHCSTQFKLLFQRVETFKALHCVGNVTAATAAANALSNISIQIQTIFRTFNACQQKFNQWCQANQDYESSSSSPDLHPQFGPRGPPQLDQVVLLEEEEDIAAHRARHQDIITLVESIQDIHNMFVQLNSMVIMQGDLLDRIDVHVEHALQHVDQANGELRPAERYSRDGSRMKWICLISLFVIFIGLLVGVIFKFKNR